MRRVEYFIYPQALGLDIFGPLDVFSTATLFLEQNGKTGHGYRPVFSAEKPGLVMLTSGMQVHAEIPIGKGQPADIFLVPGGLGVDQVAQDKGLISAIRSQAGKANRIVSVCGGTFILAACGFLKNKKATTHWECADELGCRHPDIDVVSDAIYVHDGHISTSAGVTAGIDLALAIVEEDFGSSLAMDVARKLVVYLRRAGGQSQFSAPVELRYKAGKKFNDLHDWILKNLDKPISVEQLADRAAMSPRNFSRAFAAKTGITPGKYVELMRLDRAREILECGDESMASVAEASGFVREDRLRRAFLRQLGTTPSQYRLHFNASPSTKNLHGTQRPTQMASPANTGWHPE